MATKKTTKKKTTKAKVPKIPATILSLEKNLKSLEIELEALESKKPSRKNHPKVTAPRTDIALRAQWRIRLQDYQDEWEEDLKMHEEGVINITDPKGGYYGKWSRRGEYFDNKGERLVIALAYGGWKAGKDDYEVAEECGIGSSTLSRYLQANVEIRALRDNIGVNIPKMAQDGLVKSMEELMKNPSTPNAVGQFLKVLQATDEQNYGAGRYKQEIDAEVNYGLSEEEKRDADNFLDNVFEEVNKKTTHNKWSKNNSNDTKTATDE